MERHPIDTAPRDGTVIRLFNDEAGIAEPMAWSDENGRWEGLAFAVARSVPTYWDPAAVQQPTHWAPIE